MRQTAFFFLLLFIQTGVSAQTTDYRKQQNYKEWVHLAPKFNDAFFRTEEAQRIGDNVLLYYKRQNKLFHFQKTFCSQFTFINTKQNVHFTTKNRGN